MRTDEALKLKQPAGPAYDEGYKAGWSDAQMQEAKPVAWMYTSNLAGNQKYITRFQSDLTTYKADKVWPLYTAQPKLNPLTDEEILSIACMHISAQKDDVLGFVRAYEAARAII